MSNGISAERVMTALAVVAAGLAAALFATTSGDIQAVEGKVDSVDAKVEVVKDDVALIQATRCKEEDCAALLAKISANTQSVGEIVTTVKEREKQFNFYVSTVQKALTRIENKIDEAHGP